MAKKEKDIRLIGFQKVHLKTLLGFEDNMEIIDVKTSKKKNEDHMVFFKVEHT